MGIWELPGARFSLIKFGKGLHYFYKCDTILSRKNIVVCFIALIRRRDMADKYFVVKQKALPEVLLKVVEAKRLLEAEKVMTVQEATEAVDISRSSFYKYKDDIFPFHENARGKTITLIMQVDDTPGLLSNVLALIAEYHANILTIHQTIPINGIASLTMSVEILAISGNSSEMIEKMEAQVGVHYVKILSRE